ncbi:hypothetical protein FAP39_17240 [Shimia litoralis]|uniref:Uncharacterized protein n=1 Tax=Shimia litoralis TaxID=420403 RepID=A0A4U7MRT9_9RHOB|nr:hypothetical protein [Shimia litoralis]TKZ15436.1 hypothetical protein FAP39_17240 [Shimia litoralis]
MVKSRLIKKKNRKSASHLKGVAQFSEDTEPHETNGVTLELEDPFDKFRFELPTRRNLVKNYDFTCLATGLSQEDLAPNHRGRFLGDYTGRPKLSGQLLDAIKQKIRGGSESAGRQLKSNLGNLYRALDEIERVGAFKIDRLEDITDEVAEQIAINMIDKATSSYGTVKTVISRSIKSACPEKEICFRPAPRAASEIRFVEKQKARMRLMGETKKTDTRIPTDQEMKKVARAILAETKELCRNFKDGQRLVQSEPKHRHRNQWRKPDYVAKRFHDAIAKSMLTGGFTKFDLGRHLGPSVNFLGRDVGASYLPPSRKSSWAYINAMRWFIPVADDMYLLALQFLIMTGWNIEVALRLDVSDTGKWVTPHPIDPDLVVLRSVKTRAKGVMQYAVSKLGDVNHPYQIIQRALSITEPLRVCLRTELATIAEMYQQPYPREIQSRVNRIKDMLKSPWLYFNTNEIGRIGLVDTGISWELTIALRALLEKHGHDDLLWMTVSDFRDGYISDVYAASGHQYIVAQLAAGHENIKSLRHYLNNALWRNKSFKSTRRFQDALFKLIGKRPV